WRDRALAWIGEQIAVVGMDEPRLRAWSITMRVRTARGPVWFKANPPDSRFEAGLTEALSRWAPEQVLTPLAVDAAEGWSLLPDGGTEVRETDPDLATWENLLRQYAELQRSVAPHIDELARLGVPDLRPDRLPARFAELVDSAVVRAQLSPAQQAALTSAAPRFAEECAALAASPVPASVDHSDVHEGQAFVADGGRFVFFDWGDASIAHPFTSFLVAYRAAAHRLGPGHLDRLRDAYLEPWTAEHPIAELRTAAELAVRVGPVSRALSWGRVFPEAAHVLDAEHGKFIAEWLLHIVEPEAATLTLG
ncbi:MAG TPA: phosphotransferase, partial [Pseudonocardiaceae bacterium]